jgi:photosystem II stability/assembly factor-like uncharacterized protein
MINSTFVLSLSFCLLLSCGLSQQKNDRDYPTLNSQGAIYTYTEDSCYSRAILVDDSLVFMANSNGRIYTLNLSTNESKEIAKGLGLKDELRDIALVNGKIYALQSGSTGKLVQIDTEKGITVLAPPFWKGLFLDGMDFHGETGFMMGDPAEGNFSLFLSEDGGNTWTKTTSDLKASDGEAGFAASGTNVQVLNDSICIFVSGGIRSRFFKSTNKGKTWFFSDLPFDSCEGCGPFSVSFVNEKQGVVVGGNYTKPDKQLNTSFYTQDGGHSWKPSKNPVLGYRSSVHFAKGVYYACGTTGIDYSVDFGVTWLPFAYGKFFALTSDEQFLYVTIPNGSFSKFNLIR